MRDQFEALSQFLPARHLAYSTFHRHFSVLCLFGRSRVIPNDAVMGL